MSGEAEAAGDVLTGAVIGATVGTNAGIPRRPDAEVANTCRNCGACVVHAYCSRCGQRAHLHRSLVALAHDIAHGVLHLEGKMWRTIPELFFHPGRLTRRYVRGERAKFVSPMALFLFTVFVMYAVFSLTNSALFSGNFGLDSGVVVDMRSSNAAAVEAIDEKIEALREQLERDEPGETVSMRRRAGIERDIDELQAARKAAQALANGDWAELAQLNKNRAAPSAASASDGDNGIDVNLGWPALETRLERGIRELQRNPSLGLYKIKIAAYKYSWALIPLSVPFLWLLFFWQREFHLYDHAIFVTYSISFMMLLLSAVSLTVAFGVSAVVWGTALAFVPPLHLYKQLRVAYGLSRFGAWLRLFLLSILISIVLTIFTVLLMVVGLLG